MPSSQRLGLRVGRAGDDDRDEIGPVLAEPGQVRAVGAEQAPGLLDDPVEDDVGLAEGGDPGGDVAQGPLGVGPPGDGRLRLLELLDQAGVGDGDGRLVGQPAEDRLVDVVERVAVAADRPRWRRAGPSSPMIGATMRSPMPARPRHLVGLLERAGTRPSR